MPGFKKRFNRKRRKRGKKMPIVRLIRKVIKSEAEHKYHSFNDTESNITAALPYTADVTNIGNGTDVNTRIGNIVDFEKVRIRYTLRSSINTNAYVARVYLIQSYAETDPVNLPSIEDLFPTLADSQFRYKVLYDRTFQFGLGINQVIVRDINVKKRLLPGKWASNSGQTQVMGNIVLHILTDNAELDALNSVVDSRVYFLDS